MGRRVDVESLVGAREIADRLGFKHPQHVHHYLRHDPKFPRPVAAIGGPTLKTMVWAWPDVERWARRVGKLPKKGAPTPAGDTTGITNDEGSTTEAS